MREELTTFCQKIAGSEAAELLFERLLDTSSFEMATIHPYGFYIWKMPEISPSFSLRVHVWLPRARKRQQPDWPPHSHNSNLHSFILAGQITNCTWEWEPDGAGHYQMYEVGYDGGLSSLRKTSVTGNLVAEKRHVYRSGSSYLVPSGVYHASEVDERSSAVTVVLLDRNIYGTSKVIGAKQGENRYVFNREAASDVDQRKASEVAKKAILQIV